MFDILSLILPQPKRTKEERKEDSLAEITKVVDQIAYKHSIPQPIIIDIVWTWMQYSHKRMGLD